MLVRWSWYKRYHSQNTPPTVQIRIDTTLSTTFRIPFSYHIAKFLHTFVREHTIISDMAADVPRDVDAMVDCTVPIIVTILTCWFMEWLRRGRQAQVDEQRHDEQMALLRKIEAGSFTFAPRIEKPATPQPDGTSLGQSKKPATSQPDGVSPSRSHNPATSQSDGVSLGQNDKLSKLRVDFIGMLEDCAKLQDAHHSDLSQLEVDVQIANEEKQNLAKELQKAQASLKLSEKEAFDAKAKQIHVANEAAAQLNALQSKYDTAVVDLKAAEGNARRVTFAQQPNGSHNDSTAELQALQAKYDAVVQDLQTAREDVDRISLEAQSNHDHGDLVAELEVMQAKYKQVLYDLAVSEVKAQEAEKTREAEKAKEAEKTRDTEKSSASNESEDDTAEKLKDLQAEYLQAVQDREDAELKANEEQGKRVLIEIKYNDTFEMLGELKPCLEKKEEEYEQLKKEKTKLERRVLNLEKGVYSDIKEAIRKEFSETSDKLQTQLGKLDDENKQLKEKIDAAEKKCLELETSTKAASAPGANESVAESPVFAEVFRSHLDFERRLSQTEEGLRTVQHSLAPIISGRTTPTGFSLSPTRSGRAGVTSFSPTRSGRATPTSPTKAWSALGKLPADTPSDDNMDLYESPPSAVRRGSTTTTRTRPSAPRSQSGPASPLFGSRPSSRHGPASSSSQSSRSPSAFEGKLEFEMGFNKPFSPSSSSAAGPSSPRAPPAPRAEQKGDIFGEDTW
jgi:hypothetical protein